MGDHMNTKMTACLLSVLLAACAGEVGTPEVTSSAESTTFGDAVHQNMAAQIDNPEAPAAHPLEASGARAAIADQRYRTDTVEKATMPRTQGALDEGQ